MSAKHVNFFSELERRNVYKVAVAYAVVGWLLIQVATQVFSYWLVGSKTGCPFADCCKQGNAAHNDPERVQNAQ